MAYPFATLRQVGTAIGAVTLGYFCFLGLLAVSPSLQAHVFYLHSLGLTWPRDINIPEQFGFLKGQANSLFIDTEDGETLHAWHILPPQKYLKYQQLLVSDDQEVISRPTDENAIYKLQRRKHFGLLRDDPDAYLVIYFHGNAGTIAAGWRPLGYRSLYSTAPDKVHILAFDYRGFGQSTGFPSEEGLIRDAAAIIDWAINVALVPPSHIILFGQSLGTAVVAAAVQRHVTRAPSVKQAFAGIILAAPFSDVATLTATYRIAGVLPLLSPLAGYPRVMRFFQKFITSPWPTTERLKDYVRAREDPVRGGWYHLTLLHGMDDRVVPANHSRTLYEAAVAAAGGNVSLQMDVVDHGGRQGWVAEHRSHRGIIRIDALRYGPHNTLVTFAAAGTAVWRAIDAAELAQGFQDPSKW